MTHFENFKKMLLEREELENSPQLIIAIQKATNYIQVVSAFVDHDEELLNELDDVLNEFFKKD